MKDHIDPIDASARADDARAKRDNALAGLYSLVGLVALALVPLVYIAVLR